MKKCVVIGGGVIGLCSAYYLAKAGHQVTIIDKSDMTDGCSYGNAGMIVPSHVIPLAQPGMISKGFRWMFDNKSPFFIKPRLSTELIRWGWQFYRHSNQAHVEKAMPILRDLSLFSKELFDDLAKDSNSFSLQEKGLLMLFQSDKNAKIETQFGEAVQKMGQEVNFLSSDELQKLQPNVKTNSKGAVYYKNDAHLSPRLFMEFLVEQLVMMGVDIQKNEWVEDFKINGDKIEYLITNDEEIKADEFILCAGSWSPMVAKKLGVKINLLPGKGYSFDVERRNDMPTIPSILSEGKVAVTPMLNKIRFGGTLEITKVTDRIVNMNRVGGMLRHINSFYPDIEINRPNSNDIWSGLRPCTPTGLPIISRSDKLSNLVLATGHGMMGLSLGPATGKLVEELISSTNLSVNLDQ